MSPAIHFMSCPFSLILLFIYTFKTKNFHSERLSNNLTCKVKLKQ